MQPWIILWFYTGGKKMKDISKIIKIDMLSVRPYLTLKNLIIMIVMGIIYPLINKNIYTIYGVTQVFGILFCSYPFLVGDESGIDALYGAFGIERKNVVYGRYIWSNLVILICLIIGIVFSVIVSILINEAIKVQELIYIIPIVFFISNFVIASQYPFYFKYGYAKSRIIMSSMFFIMAILAFSISYFKNSLMKPLEILFNNVYLLIFGSLLFFAILYLSSIATSIKLYKKRELI